MTDYDTSGTRDSSTESFIPIPFMQLVQEWEQLKAENARLREGSAYNFHEAEKVPWLQAENAQLREALRKLATLSGRKQ